MDEVLGSHAAQFISICESVKLEKQIIKSNLEDIIHGFI